MSKLLGWVFYKIAFLRAYLWERWDAGFKAGFQRARDHEQL